MRWLSRLLGVALLLCCTTAHAANAFPLLTRLGRWLGYGWSDGYQADAWYPVAAQPPVGFFTPVRQGPLTRATRTHPALPTPPARRAIIPREPLSPESMPPASAPISWEPFPHAPRPEWPEELGSGEPEPAESPLDGSLPTWDP